MHVCAGYSLGVKARGYELTHAVGFPWGPLVVPRDGLCESGASDVDGCVEGAEGAWALFYTRAVLRVHHTVTPPLSMPLALPALVARQPILFGLRLGEHPHC